MVGQFLILRKSLTDTIHAVAKTPDRSTDEKTESCWARVPAVPRDVTMTAAEARMCVCVFPVSACEGP